MTAQPLLVAGGFAALSLMLLWPVPRWLARASWPARSPRAALVLWQAVAAAGGLSLTIVALALAVAPLAVTFRHGVHVFVLQTLEGDPFRGLCAAEVGALAWAAAVVGWLVWFLARTAVRNARLRRRHRARIDLLAERSARHGGVHVIDHPVAAAYCVPGPRTRVVITSGLVALLDERELAAVLDHERAHARGRHHLVLLPFDALAAAARFLPAARIARERAAALVEMLADDHARGRHGGRVVAMALLRLAEHRVEAGAGSAGTPAGALGAAEHAVLSRVRRLSQPAVPIPAWQRLAAYLSAAALITAPLTLLVPCLA